MSTGSEVPVITFVVIIVAALASGGFCSWLAEEKGRSFGTWFLLGLLFGPLALLALVGAPVVESQQVEQRPITQPQATTRHVRSLRRSSGQSSQQSPVDEFLAQGQRERNRARRAEIERNKMRKTLH